MKGVPEGIRKDSRAPIPAKTIRLAARAAAIPSLFVTLVMFIDGLARKNFEWVNLLAGAGTFVLLFPLILFAMARMRAGIDWNRRGGRPDTDS